MYSREDRIAALEREVAYLRQKLECKAVLVEARGTTIDEERARAEAAEATLKIAMEAIDAITCAHGAHLVAEAIARDAKARIEGLQPVKPD